jgi:hypothetical protein
VPNKGSGEAWGTKPLIIISSEFAKQAVVFEKVVGQDKDLVSDDCRVATLVTDSNESKHSIRSIRVCRAA